MKNVKLLKDTLDWIKFNPKTHDQGNWGHYDEEACETTMCFAGHAAILAGGTFNKDIYREEDEWHVDKETGKHVETQYREYDDDNDTWDYDDSDLVDGIVHVADFAARVLGLSDDERTYLFSGSRSLAEIEEAVEKFCDGYSYTWNRKTNEWGFVKEDNNA